MSELPQYQGRELEAMSLAENYQQWMFREFSPCIGRRVLEVGAGIGTLTEKILDAGAEQIMALEPSANLYPSLRSRFPDNQRVIARAQFLADCAAELRGAFDTALYINVLEHIEDDHREMKMALECLTPGGHLIVFVPALPWLHGSADEQFGHFRRYTKTTLLEAFRGLNMEVRRCRYFDVMGVLPWWLSFVVLRKSTLSPAMVRLYDRLVVPWAAPLERLTDAWPVGKNLLLVVRKTGG